MAVVDGVEVEGRTVGEATDKALEELGLTRAEVDVEVLTEGRPRLLGFRGEPARVRVTPKSTAGVSVADEEEYDEEELEDGDDEDYELEEEEEPDVEEEMPAELRTNPTRAPAAAIEPVPVDPGDVDAARGILQNLIRLMGLEADVTPREPETAGDGVGMIQAVFDVEGDDLGLLIGRRGQTLASLQYLLNLIAAKQLGKRVAFGVDVDGYRRRREETLVSMAKRTASRVRNTGRSITLEPMPANERRIVHLTLADDPYVMTVSIGEGDARKVAVTPAK